MTLLAAYHFDESSGDFIDVTGGGHNIPIGVNATRGTGHTGSALTKVATGMPVLADPAIGRTAHRTLMFWLRGTGGTWWVRWNADALGSGAWGILNLGGFVCVQARDTSGALLSPRPQVALPGDDAWHHYAATYDGSTVRLYLDATLVSSGALAGGLYALADRVDLAEWSTAATFLDDLRIYDEALDQPAIAALKDTPVTAGPAPVDDVTGGVPVEVEVGGVLNTPAATVAALTASVPVVVGADGQLFTPAATVPELSGGLPVTVGLASALEVPVATVPAATGATPVVVGITGVLDVPTATVHEVTSTLPVEVGFGGVFAEPGVPVDDVTVSLPVVVSLTGALSTPSASVPALSGGLAVTLSLSGVLSSGAAGPTPAERTAVVAAESRVAVVAAESRVVEVT